MDLSNSFAALDPRNPGFIGLDSESEMDSLSDGYFCLQTLLSL